MGYYILIVVQMLLSAVFVYSISHMILIKETYMKMFVDTILFVIGPEGGFSNEEENILINNGFISTSLGSRVLRTETASTFVLSIINYIFMR